MSRQTETGSIVLAPFPGAIETKPGSVTFPFFGHVPAIMDAMTGEASINRVQSASMLIIYGYSQELKGNNVEGVLVLKNCWPSIARTIYRDHQRYIDTYMKVNEFPEVNQNIMLTAL